MITSEAMIVICTMMRMLVGMNLRMRLTELFAMAVTKMRARHMVTAVSSFVVTARAEQIPRICKAMGLSSKIGPSRVSRALPM